MTIKERVTLIFSGVIVGKINYSDVTNVILLPHFLLKFDMRSFPDMQSFDDIFYNTATNTTVLTFRGKDIGLRLTSDSIRGNIVSISLSHPVSDYWLSVFEPIWKKQNEGKCKTCRGTGWDGETYTLTCMECGGDGLCKI